MQPKLRSVNIGAIREVEHNGRLVETGIFKTPTTERLIAANHRLGDDVQADLNAHGGPDKAIYAYATEDSSWWADTLGRTIEPGFFGENLTTEGVDVSGAMVGDRWRVGSALLEVSEPRVPCFKLGIKAGIPRFQKTFAEADRPGAYLRIVEAGDLGVGDAIDIETTNLPSVSMSEIGVIYHRDHQSAAKLLDVDALSDSWKSWAAKTL